jgi:hypothetical protein
MKSQLLAGALVGAILMGDYQPRAKADPQPEPKLIGIDDCIELAAAAVFIGSLYACWYHGISNPGTNDVSRPPLPLPTHDGDPDMNGTNDMSSLHLNAVACSPCDGFGFDRVARFSEQATTNLVDWSTRLDFKVWESPVGHLMLVSSNGVPVWTNYAVRNTNGISKNYCPLLPNRDKQHEFFRLLSQ